MSDVWKWYLDNMESRLINNNKWTFVDVILLSDYLYFGLGSTYIANIFCLTKLEHHLHNAYIYAYIIYIQKNQNGSQQLKYFLTLILVTHLFGWEHIFIVEWTLIFVSAKQELYWALSSMCKWWDRDCCFVTFLIARLTVVGDVTSWKIISDTFRFHVIIIFLIICCLSSISSTNPILRSNQRWCLVGVYLSN